MKLLPLSRNFAFSVMLLSFLLSSIIYAQETTIISVHAIAWSPDGSRIAIGIGTYEAETHDYSIRLVDATTGQITTRLNYHSSGVNSLDWSPDGSLLISTSSDGIAALWDMSTNQIAAISQPYSMPNRFADIWSPLGDSVANVSDGIARINIWDSNNQTTLDSFTIPDASTPHSIDWNSSASRLVTGQDNGNVVIWDATTGELLQVLSGHSGIVRSVEWSSNGNFIVSGGSDNTVRIWDASTSELLFTLQGHTGDVRVVTLSSDDLRIASASVDGTVKVWSVVTGALLTTYTSSSPVFSVDWSPDGTRLVYGEEGVEISLQIERLLTIDCTFTLANDADPRTNSTSTPDTICLNASPTPSAMPPPPTTPIAATP